MELDPVILSRIQFAFVISFHIIFPAFTIGLAAWLATIEGMRLFTGNPVYRRVFDFWLKIFAVSFGMGVVTGIVMAFQFGTNWGVLAERTGSIQGPLLGYEAFTAFMLEATFFGVMLLGRDRVSPGVYFFACCMVSLGTMFSSFWILANNSWMQVPLGHEIVDGKIIPADWREIVLGPVQMVRWPHMLLAALPDDRHVRRRDRRLVHAARDPSSGGAGHAALGPRAGGGADPGAAVLRPPHRPLRAQAPAGEVRGDRGALAEPATGLGGADRLARRGEPTQPASRSRSRGSAASSPRATGPPARSGWTPFPSRTVPRCSSRSSASASWSAWG